MKKILVMSALVAISAAFVACSSDDDLVQQKPDVPEETVDEGTPLTISLVDVTRGTDWTTKTLPQFTLYSTEHDGTTRWLGARDEQHLTSSTGALFRNTSDTSEGEHDPFTGTFANDEGIYWPQEETPKAYDFYALSDATFVEESDGGEGTQDAEHLDAVSRSFTYSVPTVYNGNGEQTDLLVAAALEQKSNTDNGNITLPFKHALAQIGQITLNFSEILDQGDPVDNSAYYFIIKSIIIHGLKSTGTYTFPDTWNDDTYNNGTWTALDGSEPADGYQIELPQFQLDDNKNYLIFDEDNNSDPFDNEATGFATGTKRGGIASLPNYFQAPASGTSTYVLPIAKKTGTEGAYAGSSFVPTKAENAAYTAINADYTVDGGLYIIPQALGKTVWKYSGSDIVGVESGVYAEVRGIILNSPDPTDFSQLDVNVVGAKAPWLWNFNNVNNAEATQILNHKDYIGSYLVPLVKAKKELKAGNRYNLTFELSQAVTLETGACVFDGAEVQ